MSNDSHRPTPSALEDEFMQISSFKRLLIQCETERHYTTFQFAVLYGIYAIIILLFRSFQQLADIRYHAQGIDQGRRGKY